MFPTADMPGVDLVLPDFTYLLENADRIEGVLLTHGHEDHVGGLSFLLREISVPIRIYSSELTLALARGRIEEAGLLDRVELIAVRDGERRAIGPFDCQFIPVTHSVPHGFATVFFTPQGTIVHSGDFKLDQSPVDGRVTDLALLGEIARQGVRLVLSDSTNAEEAGYTPSESSVGLVMRTLFREHPDKRIIAACFASHLHRIQQIAEAAFDEGRVVAFLGRSMGRNVRLAGELGLLDLPESRVVDITEADRYAPGELCIICTGSQGEPMSALALMAAHENKWVKVSEDDLVVISAHPIPGNEVNVGRVIDGLYRTGAEVVHSGLAPVHVSGHASQEELRFFLNLLRPEHFIPVHGEYRHLVHHGRLARQVGVSDERVLLLTDGDAAVLGPEGIDVERHAAPAGYLYVDGIVGDVGHGVLRDRRVLAAEGMVVVVVTVDVDRGEIVTGPEIVTRGWVYAPEAEDLIDEAIAEVRAAVQLALTENASDFDTLRRHTRTSLARFIKKRTQRRPIIVPVVMEV